MTQELQADKAEMARLMEQAAKIAQDTEKARQRGRYCAAAVVATTAPDGAAACVAIAATLAAAAAPAPPHACPAQLKRQKERLAEEEATRQEMDRDLWRSLDNYLEKLHGADGASA